MLLSRFQEKLLDSRRKRDYIYLIIIGFLPILVSYFIGVNDSIPLGKNSLGVIEYRGYWHSYNWMHYPVTLPLALWFLRRVANKLFALGLEYESVNFCNHNKIRFLGTSLLFFRRKLPLKMRKFFRNFKKSTQELFNNEAPLLVFFRKTRGSRVESRIRRWLKELALNPWLSIIILSLDIIFIVFDAKSIFLHYIGYFQDKLNYPHIAPKLLDWSTFFTIPLYLQLTTSRGLHLPPEYGGDVNAFANLFFTVIAYLNQFIITFITWMFIILLFVHNLFYLNRIYIRSRNKSVDSYIVLDFKDTSLRFGLKGLDFIFDLQIVILVLVGIGLLTSRYAYVSPVELPFQLFRLLFNRDWTAIQDSLTLLKSQWEQSEKFPNLGQWVIAIAWMLGFFVVSIPSFAKFLPLMSPRLFSLDRIQYFRDFIPPEYEKSYPEDVNDKYDLSTMEGADYVETLFETQSFWPMTDANAEKLFAFAWFVFILIFMPIKLNLTSIFALGILACFGSRVVTILMRKLYLSFRPRRPR